jgi:hypothetical protein
MEFRKLAYVRVCAGAALFAALLGSSPQRVSAQQHEPANSPAQREARPDPSRNRALPQASRH